MSYQIKYLSIICSLLFVFPAMAEQANKVLPTQHHGHQQKHLQYIELTESGTDLFATIQEVIRKLEANPDTDWSKVNLEALREHLRDMFEFS